MRHRMIARVALAASFVIAALSLGTEARADAPAPTPVTPELIAAAQSEGKVVYYTALDLQVSAKLGKAFEARYPGIAVQVERGGAERVYQRVDQEYGSGIHAVDAIDSTDVSHFVDWKRRGLLGAYVPADVTRWPADQRDGDGYYATHRALLLVVAYNTRLVAENEAPRSYADLLDPKWRGKIVKAHPSYAGTILTATFELSRALGWSYFEKLGQQRVMQVQSSTEPPKKLALGERAIMFDGNEYVTLLQIRAGAPISIVYPVEGTPFAIGSAGLMKDAPHPNAARLFVSFLFSREGQQFLVDEGELRSFHPDVTEPAGRVPLAAIKRLTADPAELEKAADEVKRRYAEYFGT
jgi:iron(III) transport system substrate-binding protein